MEKHNLSRKELATQLKNRRRIRKASRKKIAASLSLPDSTLAALEDPEDQSIPISYLPNLYRKYATFLEFDDEIINSIDELIIDNKTGLRINKKVGSRQTYTLSKTALATAVAMILMVIAGYALYQVRGLTAAPVIEVVSPLNDSVTAKSELIVSGSSDSDVTVLVNGDPVPVGEDGRFEQIVYLQPGHNTVDISAVNSFARETNEPRTVYFLANSHE